MKRCLLFPQCGSQYVGMGKELYDSYRVVQEYFEEAIECSDINFIKLSFASSEIDIMAWEHGPLVLFLIESATSSLLNSANITYDALIPLDITSWYAAVHAANALTLPDGLYILRKWIESAQELRENQAYGTLKIDGSRASTDSMVATISDQALERNFLIRVIAISPTNIIVGGGSEGLLYMQDILQREEVPYEYHDGVDCTGVALPTDRITQVQQYLEKIDFREPKLPIMNPLTGDWLTTAEELRNCARELFIRPLRQDRVVRTLQSFSEAICSVPASRILPMLKNYAPDTQWWSFDTEAEYARLRHHVALEHEKVQE